MINVIPFSLAFVHASTSSLVCFSLVCTAVVFAFIGATIYVQGRRSNLVAFAVCLCVAVVTYLVLIAGIVLSGALDRFFIPLGPLFLVGTVSFAMSIGFTKLGASLVEELPIALLVAFQGFRLPLELVLHDWYVSGTIPETMTWSGSNWDILSGILACLTCLFVTNRRWLAWAFNLVGILLLLNVARVAIMSSPVPFGWQTEPSLELILFLPYAYIVPICVGGAALGHVLLTRKLKREAAL
jgi:hypothetical protein